MTNPNIMSLVGGVCKTSTLVVTTTPTSFITNLVNSNKLIKITSIYISNINGISSGDINIDLYRGTTSYYLAKTITIPADTTLEFLNSPIYLEEGDSLRASANEDNYLSVTCSYEAVSDNSNVFGSSVVIPIEYLIAAGGGGGGSSQDVERSSAGGGAGGLITGSMNLSSGINYLLTVGAGGNGGAPANNRGSTGSNSVLASYTSYGGGGGGAGYPGDSTKCTGGNGGSGGGAGYNSTNEGLGTSGQGYNGAEASGTLPGGGGGAGAAAVGPAGGNGAASSITGASTYYAGGGSAGKTPLASAPPYTAGLGGGGTGGQFSNDPTFQQMCGTANTGGGGGGGGVYNTTGGGNGGSGIIIIAYPDTYPALSSVDMGLQYTISTSSRSGYRVYKFLSGTGYIGV